ncbi:MAG: 23S rRNA (pseudouridine(1915)-N(3))-methyltransferase RlmH [Eubacteriales bacterium]|nr:23S rRNA (pseudouridine(1915)-N(3))-methyltransferase RlmH [Lachnospiraceae bacterium]MDO5127613.1 23S rRNA (pseudouridine(1915)-N(3))-methyltransferase RlmH [Eubacteriales bacterium]
MKIKLIAVGNVKEAYYRNQIEATIKQIKRRHVFSLIEVKDESIPKNAGSAQEEKIREIEGKRILGNIKHDDYVYALCIDGLMLTTKQLNRHMTEQSRQTDGDLVFVIGGSLGLSEMVARRANYKLSFSKLTFPHQLMRVMLLEQLETLS